MTLRLFDADRTHAARAVGRSCYAGRCEFVSEPGEPFADGFELPAAFQSLEAQ